MNIYKGLNEITKYIEEHLEEDIQYQNLAKIIGVDVYTMKRIFFLLCNISITEYIRKRRLSNAGCDLMNQKQKVMEIAVKYQYDSATSFSRAFSHFHGIKPSKVDKNTTIRVTISSGVGEVEVPSVTGVDKETAEAKLAENGFIANANFEYSE